VYEVLDKTGTGAFASSDRRDLTDPVGIDPSFVHNPGIADISIAIKRICAAAGYSSR
jgi:hypothetical protein